MTQILVRPSGQNRIVYRQGGTRMSSGGGTSSGGSSAWLQTDFSEFANASDVQAASWYEVTDYTAWSSTSGMSLDTTEGYGTSDRCLKTNWSAGDFPGWGIGLSMPTTNTENWTEIWFKLSTTWDSDGGAGPNPDWKFVFWLLTPAASLARNEFKIGEYGTLNRISQRYEGGPDTIFTFAASNLNDNTWHRYRAHNKITPGSSGAIFNTEFWDGVNSPQQQLQTGITLDPSYTDISHMYLGANRNRPPLVDMWAKWGKISIYNTDPGWGI